MIDIDTSIEIVKKTCLFREQEPLRLADRISFNTKVIKIKN